MKSDFSRLTFNAGKHFSRVLMQQGRVQLDADWNEQASILLHYIQALAKDLLGRYWGPAENCAFELNPAGADDFSIGNGHYYVDGILCENEGNDGLFTYLTQAYYPLDQHEDKLTNGKTVLVYVDVWEHLVTYIDDDSIREVALGGPDTAARARVVWQIKVEGKTPDGEDIPNGAAKTEAEWRKFVNEKWPGWEESWQPSHRGMLKAWAKQDAKKNTDPCISNPEASYRGMENQLYRVEIHQAGRAGVATFKWSRDNASMVAAVRLNGMELTVENPRGLVVGKWLELLNEAQELRGEPGTLVKIKHIDGDLVSLDLAVAPTPLTRLPKDELWPCKARLWDSAEINIVEAKDFGLEQGINIQFQAADGQNRYRTGDYWIIPVRVATGDVEWPGDVGNPKPLPPHGIEHHYAPIAVVVIDAAGAVTPFDLRKLISLG